MFTQPTDLFKFTQHKQKNISVHFHCCPVNFAELSTTLTLSERGNIYTTRDMNWDPLPETRCKYVHVRSNAAPTTMDGGSAGFAGAKSLPCGIRSQTTDPSSCLLQLTGQQ